MEVGHDTHDRNWIQSSHGTDSEFFSGSGPRITLCCDPISISISIPNPNLSESDRSPKETSIGIFARLIIHP